MCRGGLKTPRAGAQAARRVPEGPVQAVPTGGTTCLLCHQVNTWSTDSSMESRELSSCKASCADLEARDARDTQRSVAPLKPAQDALQLDNSLLSIEESVDQVLTWWQSKQVVPPVGTA